MKSKKNIIYCLIILAPIIINYSLFTWRAPGVFNGDWLSFLGSYLGIIGAILIAVVQMRNQKKRDHLVDLESKRAFIVVTDFTANMQLHNIDTHADSRIIHTPGYLNLKSRFRRDEQQRSIQTCFLNISHYGNSDVILDCRIQVDYGENKINKKHRIDINIGVVQKGIEVFIPLVPPGSDLKGEVLIDLIQIDYKTLMNEQMRYVINHLTNKEMYIVIDDIGNETILFQHDITVANWTLPNKSK